MMFFNLPQKPNCIIPHPTKPGWLFEDYIRDYNTIINEYDLVIEREDRYNPIKYNIKQLHPNGQVELLFENYQIPFFCKDIKNVNIESFLKAPTQIRAIHDTKDNIQTIDYSLDKKYCVALHVQHLKNQKKYYNYKTNTFNFTRHNDIEDLFTKSDQAPDCGVVIFNRYDGTNEIVSPYPEWIWSNNDKLQLSKRQIYPIVAISKDALTIIACYPKENGTCIGAIFDNPLIT